MEEILNPEVEVQDVAPVAEVEVAPATVEVVEAPAAEKEAKKAQPATKQEVIARLKEIALDASNAERAEIDLLKQIYYKIHNAEAAAAREEYINNGGLPEDFMPAPDNSEAELKVQLNIIKEARQRAAEALEAEKQNNLEKKLAIIERIKELVASPEDADKHYEEFKNLQSDWKDVKTVPAERATELWKNYQLYVEQYYDLLRMNHEMRAYDFKKNLEIKTALCEAAEKLIELEDVISAFHQLQKLHQDFRETGPVERDLREQIWTRFKDASTAINKRHQAHFEDLKAQEEANLARKTELCEKVEAINLSAIASFNEWEDLTKEVIALQNEWKTIGFTPKKINSQIFERFRTACDRFFQSKTEHFRGVRDSYASNLAAKTALCEKAEALKDDTDWAKTTNIFVELQKEWKTIGPAPHKSSEVIWKRFNDACNYFFEQKSKSNVSVRQEENDNLAKKNAIIEKLEALVEAGCTDIQVVKDLQAEWNGVGHVPFRKKDKVFKHYREVCDKLYEAFHATAGKRNLENFKKSVADKGGNDLSRERQRLQRDIELKKSEIQNYETNLTFFNSKSKSGNSLVEDLLKKVERLKADLVLLNEKLAAVNEQLKK